MPDRAIAAKINKPDEKAGKSTFSLELVPRHPLDGLNASTIVLNMKEGATDGQVEKLQALLNLLVVDASLVQPNAAT